MKHKQYLFLIPTLLSCHITQSMAPRVIPKPTIPHIPGLTIAGKSNFPAQAKIPKAQISKQTFNAVMDALNKRGVKQNPQGFQKLLKMEPELLKSAQYYVEQGKRTEAQQYLDYIAQEAKSLEKQTPVATAIPPLEVAMQKNSNLAQLMSTEIPATLTSTSQSFSKIAYQASSNKLATFYKAQSNFTMVKQQLEDLFANAHITPQKAAHKISDIEISLLQTLTDNAQQVAHEAVNTPFQEIAESIVNNLNKLKLDLTRTKGFLQSSVSAESAAKPLTNMELEEILKKVDINSMPPTKTIIPEEHLTHLSGTTQNIITTSNQALQVAMTDNITEFKNNIATTKAKTLQLIQQITNLPDLTKEQKFALEKARPMIDKQINLLQQVFSSLAQHTDQKSALFAYTQKAPNIVRMIENISLILTTLINALTPTQQQKVLPLIQSLDELLTDANHFANMMQIIAREILSESSSLQEIKKVMDKVAIQSKINNSITAMQSSLNEIQKLAQETGLETDKASPSMLEVIHSSLQKRVSDINELKKANNIQELEEKITELKTENSKVSHYLELLRSKIEALRVSPQQQQLVQLVEHMIKEFNITNQFINTIEQKISEIDEEHIWIDIAKNTITQGITRHLRDGKTIIFYLQEHINKSEMTPTQLQAYKDLVAEIQKLKEIQDQAFKMTNTQDLSRLAHQLDPNNASNILNPSNNYAENIEQLKKLLQISNLNEHNESVPFLKGVIQKYTETLDKTKVAFATLLGIGIAGGAMIVAKNQNISPTNEALLTLSGDLELLKDSVSHTSASNKKAQVEPYSQSKQVIEQNKNIAQANLNQMQKLIAKTQAIFAQLQNPEQRRHMLNSIIQAIRNALANLASQPRKLHKRFKQSSAYTKTIQKKQILLNRYYAWAEDQQKHADEIIALASK